MLPSEWKKEIINIPGEVDWVLETARQLVKDFAMLNHGLELGGAQGNDYKGLFQEARKILKHLYLNRYSDFQHLLYRIDLPEQQLHVLVAEYSGEELYDQLTSRILMREFLKVVNRHRYAL